MEKLKPPIKISLIYFVFSVIWIIWSDGVVMMLADEPDLVTRMQTYKGWLFVLATSLLIYGLILKDYKQKEQLQEALIKRNDNLEEVNNRLVNEIEERKRIEADLVAVQKSLEEANNAKTKFLANMSHEIRTPMNGIMGMIQLMLAEDIDDKQKEYMELALNSARSLLNIINDMLDISRIELGAMQLDNHSFSLSTVIRNIFSLFRVGVENKKINLVYEQAPDIPDMLQGDSNRLNQVLMNLVGNAVKFTDSGAVRLHISVVEKKEDKILLRFSVSDTGIGIADQDLDKLFKSFSQVDSFNRRKYGGTGLGLAISQNIVELMGGKIRVESRPGQGSTFEFAAWFSYQAS